MSNSFSSKLTKEAQEQLKREMDKGITVTVPPPRRSYLALCIKVALNAKQVRA